MLNLRGWRGCRSIPLFVLERVSLNAIHIIDIISASEETKDGRTPNPVDPGQISIVPNLPDDFGLPSQGGRACGLSDCGYML